MDGPFGEHAGGAWSDRAGEPPAWPSLVAGLESMPLASLALAADGSLLAANGEWEALAGLAGAIPWGDGWLGTVDPLDRPALVTQLRQAATYGERGSADCRLAGPWGRRWSRWWWQPGSSGALVVSVADIDDDVARAFGAWCRAAGEPVSGLVGQGQFMDLLGRAVRRHRTGTVVAVVLADLDIFSEAGDGHDRRAGAQLLRAAAGGILDAIRPGDVAARVGSDQFAVLCAGLSGLGEAESMAARVREASGHMADVDGVRRSVTATTGVAVTSVRGEPASMLLARARQAMRAAKRRQRIERAVPGRTPTAESTTEGVDSLNGLADVLPAAHAAAYQRAVLEFSTIVVNRIFAAGLTLAGAASISDGPAAVGVQQAVEELDALVRDVRTVTFGLLTPSDRPEAPG